MSSPIPFRIYAGLRLLGMLLLICPALVRAGSEPELIETHEEWEVYVLMGDSGKICYVASDPVEVDEAVEADASRGQRGKTWVLVTHRPNDHIRNEVSVLAGYEYLPATEVTIVIDTHEYRLFTQGDGAWLRTPREEADIILAMRKGLRMTVVGRSEAATNTDKYSLVGFSAALRAADRACPSG